MKGESSGEIWRVLNEFGLSAPTLQVFPVIGGFSGASIWQVKQSKPLYALKAWPPGQPVYLRLTDIHQHMIAARESGLTFVPQVLTTVRGPTLFDRPKHRWELVTWQPGEPELSPTVSPKRLQAAVQALAQIHAFWRKAYHKPGPCFALQHRWQRLKEWTPKELHQLEQNIKTLPPTFTTALHFLNRHRERAMQRLEPWLDRKLPLQLCLGDIWSDHVLFTGNEVTGIIDYGGMRIDHVAQDLSRLLGSLCQGDPHLRQKGLAAYQPAIEHLEVLTVLLEETGTIVGIGNWLRWLVLERRAFADPARAEARLAQLVQHHLHRTLRQRGW